MASVGLGQRERAVLLEAGEQHILLGVAPGQVQKLHVFDRLIVSDPAAAANEKVRFADVWRQATGGEERDS